MFYPVEVTLNAYATLWRYSMDFIEKIFGFNPDGGSGAFEVLLFVILIVGLLDFRLQFSIAHCAGEALEIDPVEIFGT
jgi:hypothetical protein